MSALAVGLFLIPIDCILYCSLSNVDDLLSITVSSLFLYFLVLFSMSVLAIIGSNVSFSFSKSLIFFTNILFISF